MAPFRLVPPAVLIVVIVLMTSCAQPIITSGARSPEAQPSAPLEQLWNEPQDLERRNLVWGSADPKQAPPMDVEYQVQKEDKGGYSNGFDVVGPDGRAWDIKIGKEAQTEIVVSRILWALGYHQPTLYYMTGWKLAGEWEGEGEPARFRLQSDHESDGEWAWLENPFHGARAFHGLIAINLLLSNWDFKTSNNRLYSVPSPAGPARWFVVQDLGASLGGTAWPIGTRNDIERFETQHFVAAAGGELQFDYRGRHRDVFERVTAGDVIWACRLLDRISDRQWTDIFKAAAYPDAVAARYRTHLAAKIAEGLALAGESGVQR